MKKKILVLFIIICGFLTGCGMNKTPKKAVENFMNQYKNLSGSVLSDLEIVISKENFTEKQKDKYRDILKKQYKDINYEITNEEFDGNDATISVRIKVYDLYNSQTNASNYMATHLDEFRDDSGNFDNSKFLDYKLDQMSKTSDRVEYTIKIKVKKENEEWIIQSLSNEDLEKIHGIYNYEIE